jgi:hypothetical protein
MIKLPSELHPTEIHPYPATGLRCVHDSPELVETQRPGFTLGDPEQAMRTVPSSDMATAYQYAVELYISGSIADQNMPESLECHTWPPFSHAIRAVPAESDATPCH